MTGRQTVVMVTTSYPRFPGDTIGTFMEPIVHGLAARGHEVHVVLPWHPLLQRPAREGGVHFHPFHYAPLAALNVFGYADALKADVRLRWSAYAAAPLALTAGWNKARTIARSVDATIVHAHWVVPGGVIGAASAGHRPLVISLHGSDVYVAERHSLARRLARAAFRRAAWTTACSDDLRRRAIAIGAPPDRAEIIPYGVDADRFRPDAATRASVRRRLGVGENEPMLFSAGRFVHKKGFEYLIDAAAILVSEWPGLRLVIAGAGDLDAELRRRVDENPRVVDRVRFVGVLAHEQIADFLAAADLAVVPSVHDDEGNVDGLPNFAL